ncbi:hypothetical protein P43SY_010348 [Pythium insidiosum]|uniref:EGF-like domain-containing protein n=1 Tax=Pythium insidiosum TaxID=114742 RepID=A0AAD5M0L8_PYTIN|nr:hypothetical protein P43SY_010348 [Pythium insidiosum]
MRPTLVLAALLLACASAVENGEHPEAQGRARAAHAEPRSPSSPENETELLCHRLHLLPVSSLAHQRALAACPLQPSLPQVVKDPPGSVGSIKDKFKTDFDKQRNDLLTAKKNRRPTPAEDDALKALDAKYADIKKLQDDFNANAVKRKSDEDAALKKAQQDMDDKTKQWGQVVDDRIKRAEYDADVNAAAAAKVQDALDVQRVADAKAKLKAFEDSVMDAKAKAAGDDGVIQAFDDKINSMKTRRKADEEQRAQDELQAQKDKDLADSAEKRQREQDRAARAKQREANAFEFQDTLNRARVARDDARMRKELLARENIERERLHKQQKDYDDALAANRKSREADAVERQKRMDDYKNQEPDMLKRKKDYDDAEAERLRRAKEREDARLKREKDEADERARLKRAKEDEVPDEERPKRDDEEDCKDKKVNCGSGKCFQKKDDPESKRCQCQRGDKGKNCEHKGCEYEVTDGVGKTRKQRGNQVNGECVRWRGVYRCTCNQAWRLEVTCRQKDPVKGGTKEIEVQDDKCKGLPRPKNRYKKQACELCDRPRRVHRELEAVNATVTASNDTRALREEATAAGTNNAHLAHFRKNPNNNRMVQNTKLPYWFDDGVAMPLHDTAPATTFDECQKLCLARHGPTSLPTQPAALIPPIELNVATHCTWVWWASKEDTCYLFASGKFPTEPVLPPDEETGTNEDANIIMDTSGHVAFVAYPRLFNMFRRGSDGGKGGVKVIAGYNVVFGSGKAGESENEATFAYKSGVVTQFPQCSATIDTVREAALVFEELGVSDPSAPKAKLPADWANDFGKPLQNSHKKMTIKQKITGVDWTYELDDHMRIVKATAKTAKNGKSNRDFDALYNTLMRSPWYNKHNAASDAGHIIAQEQGPLNFFFNYVPQHFNSNEDSKGCWYPPERQATYWNSNYDTLGRGMDCTIEYTVQLVYNENGRETPSQMKGKLPDWAKASNKPPHGTRGSRAVYLEDDFICYYRYRPFTMSLDITLQPTTNENCLPQARPVW